MSCLVLHVVLNQQGVNLVDLRGPVSATIHGEVRCTIERAWHGLLVRQYLLVVIHIHIAPREGVGQRIRISWHVVDRLRFDRSVVNRLFI